MNADHKQPTARAGKRRRVLYIAAGVAAAIVVIANLAANNLSGLLADDRPAAPPATVSPSTEPTRQTWSPTPTPSTTPSATSPTGEAHSEDDQQLGDPGTDPNLNATITDGPVDPAEAAITFASIWINTYGKSPEQWRASIVDARPPIVTADLGRLLADADPATVPTGTLTAPSATPAGDALQRVTMAIIDRDRKLVGTLTVTVTGASGRWLASEIDWEPGR